MRRNLLKALPWVNVYEGDGTGAGTVTPPVVTPDPSKEKKSYTQDELNALMATNKRQLTAEVQHLTGQLEELKKGQNLTQQQRDDLQTRIDQLNNTYQTKEEQARIAHEKSEKDYKNKLSDTEKSRDTWQGRYAEENARNQIILAAHTEKAVSEEQLSDILMPKTRLAEVMIDGKPTGKYESRVKLPGQDKEGKSIELDLTIKEAVKFLKDTPDKYGNLFKSDANPGLGGGNGNKGTGQIPKIPLSLSQYKRDREKYLAQ